MILRVFTIVSAFSVLAPTASSVRRMAVASSTSMDPYCPLEKDVDLVGNDIKNVRDSWTNCCNECIATPGCKAWTWTDLNGGTCWLKSGRGTVAPKPGAISASRFDDWGSTLPEIDVDLEGSDLINFNGSRWTNCSQPCRFTPGCRAFTWTDHRGGTCWLKSSYGQPVRKSDAMSGSPFPRHETLCILERRFDFVGNDIGNVQAKAAGDCCGICMRRAGCRAFTWTNANGGTCWLKSGKDFAVGNDRAVSGVLRF
ncbi:hypothetical protein PINS_up000892 [Pythium insidiosum]|nr:hypothetical protein PINS_up000892 [Pythium insidiosum]